MGIAQLLGVVIDVYMLVLLARVVLSWVNLDRHHPAVRLVVDLTEPVLAPIRGVLPIVGGLDFSPIVALLLLTLLKRIVFGLGF